MAHHRVAGVSLIAPWPAVPRAPVSRHAVGLGSCPGWCTGDEIGGQSPCPLLVVGVEFTPRQAVGAAAPSK
jgi:hypothetical protein